MQHFVSFWWKCIRFAARGNVPYANDWQWVFANPLWQSIGTAVGATLGAALKTIWPNAILISSDTWAGVLLGGAAGFLITWMLFFLVRLIGAPSSIYYAEKERADGLQRSLNESQIDPLELKRQELVDREFLGFGPLEIEWLQRMLVTGRPIGMPDAVATTLERSGLLERGFVGVTGIKEELKAAVEHALAERASLEQALEIVVSSSSKYRETRSNPNSTTETIFVGVRNSHPTRRITNCRISMRLPENVSVYAYLLLNGFTLDAQQEQLVPVAYFHEFREKTQVPDRIRIPMQSHAGFTMGGAFELPIKPSCISFEAESTETHPRQINCKIWLDHRRKLQLEQTT
jgi:hypothetical protein